MSIPPPGAPEGPPIHELPNSMPTVNSRGPSGGNPIGKVIFVVGVLGLMLVASFYGYNRYRASRAATAAAAKQTNKNEAKPAAAGIQRNFDQDQATADAAAAHAAATVAAAANTGGLCKDGTSGVPAIGTDNQPLLSPQGVPMRICPDGHLVVPDIRGGAAAIPVASTSNTAPRPSRYGGDVMLPLADTEKVSATSSSAGAPSPGGAITPEQQVAYLASLMPGARGAAAGGGEGRGAGAGGVGGGGALGGGQLNASSTPRVSASMIGDRDMLLPKGRSIDCGLNMRLVSDLSGLATCVLSSNVYSDNGKVLLLERGSQVVGEYSSAMVQGQKRIFVLWTRIETPNGIVINLDSPGADELGTTGLPGKVDNHWWERLGGAVLLTIVQDAVGYETAKASAGNEGSYIVMQNTGQSTNNIANIVLESTIGIKPTLYKNQGDRASVFVARDLDFSTVYGLQPR